jgi:Zn-dependent protease
MRTDETVRQIQKVISFPRGVLLYCLFGLLISYLLESGPFYLGILGYSAFIFVGPLVTSVVLSWFFIESAGHQSVDTYKKLQISFYLPFFKVQLLFHLLFLIVVGSIFGRNHDSLPAIILGNVFYVFWIFIAGAVILNRDHTWQAIKEAATSTGRLLLLFILAIGIFTLLDIPSEHLRQAGRVFTWQFTFLSLAGNLFELVLIVLLMRSFILHKGQKESEAILSGYLQAPAEPDIEDEKQAMKQADKCLWLGIFSWIPLVQLFALYFGYKRFTRQKYGKVRSLFGLAMGAFFTIIYLLALVGFLTHGRRVNQNLEPMYRMASFERFSRRQTLPADIRKKVVQLKNDHHEVNISQLIQEIEELKLDDQEAYFTLGMAYLFEDENEKSLAMFQKSSAKNPADPDPYFFLGLLSLNHKNNPLKAGQNFSRFLELRPGDKIGQQYLELADNAVAWQDNILVTIFSVIVLIISVILHEFAHSYTAYKCGDPTSKEMGRMSFNPVAHLDPFGSVILPAMLIINKSPVIFGWAKPVIINPEKLKQPDRDNILISLSGCSMNFLLAMIGIVLLTSMGAILGILYPHALTNGFFLPQNITSFAGVPAPKIWAYANIFLSTLVVTNIVLGIFNLIPIPPLDGSWILERKFSPAWRQKIRKYSWVASILLLILLFTGVINIILGIGMYSYQLFMQIFVSPAMGLL